MNVTELTALVRDPAARVEQYADMVQAHYSDEMIDLYRRAWGDSFHFGLFREGLGLPDAVAATEQLAAERSCLAPGMVAVDIGCGIGGPALAIASRTGARVVGIDIVPSHVRIATERALRLGLEEQVEFVEGDGMRVPFAAESFDAVFVFESGCHMPDKRAFARECARLLRPGGVHVGFDWLCGESMTVVERAHYVEPICRAFALPSMIGLSDLRSNLELAGFDIQTVEDAANLGDLTPNWGPLAGWDEQDPAAAGRGDRSTANAAKRLAEGGRALASAAMAGFFVIGHWVCRKPGPPRP